MALIPGSIGLTGVAAPKDDSEDFYTLDPTYGIDGLRSVPTVSAMNSIPVLRRRFGMFVVVNADSTGNGSYQLSNIVLGGLDDTISNNSNFIPRGWYSDNQVRNTVLSSLNVPTYTGTLTNTDSVIIGFSKLQNQIDALRGGISWKNPVVAMTDSNITLTGEQTIHGVTTNLSRVLVNGQVDQTLNGIYITSPSAWARSSDANTNLELVGAATFVLIGDSVYGGKQFINQTNPVNIGVSNIVFVNNGNTVSYTSGNGISIVGNAIQLAALSSGKILVGSVSNVATAVNISGDATLSNIGVLTLAASGVTPGSYTNVSLTVNSKGLISLVSNGTGSAQPNYRGSVPPGTAQNLSLGYNIFSFGLTDNGSIYMCTASNSSTANWALIYGSGD